MPEGTGETVRLTVLDADGTEIDSFHSDIPAEKEDREGFYCTADTGMNEFWWSMRHPEGPKMNDTDFHGRPAGPLTLPGDYSVRLDIGDFSQTQPFTLLLDPRIDTSIEDLEAQFALQMQIRDRLSEVTTAINRCRTLKTMLGGWAGRLDEIDGGGDAASGARELSDKIDAIERKLVQPDLASEGDSLNYREQLWEKLADLVPVVASADAKPTAQSYAVFEKLSGEMDPHLSVLDELIAGDLAALNDALGALGVDVVDA